MSSFGWLELENLTNDIDLLKDEMNDAKSRNSIARVRTIEKEIAQSEERRTQLLDDLTINMVNDAEIRTHTRSHQQKGSVPGPIDDESQAAAVVDAGNDAARPEVDVDETSVPQNSTGEGSAPEQLTPADEVSPQPATVESLTKDIDVFRVRLAVAKLRKDPDLVSHLEEKIAAEQARRGCLLVAATLEAAVGAEPEQHRDTIQGPDAEDEASQLTELLLEPEQALDGVAPTTISSTDVPEQPAAEDAKSDLGDPKDEDDCDRTSVAVQEPPSEEVEHETARLAAEEHIAPSDDASLSTIDPIEEPSQAMPGDVRHPSEHDNRIAASEAVASMVDANLADIQGEATMWDQAELERTKKEIESRRDEMLDRHSKELKELLAKQADELSCLKNDRDELEALDAAISAALRKFKGPSADGGVTRLEVVA